MSPLENFWHKDKNDKELRDEVDEGVNEALDKEEEEEEIPYGLIDTNTYFEQYGPEKADEIFDWYEKAITRRGREALGSSGFLYHFFTGGSLEKTFMYGNERDGYLLGYLRHGVFVPSHFAPRSLRGGVALIKRLGDSKFVPAVLAITDDLAETIERVPSWHNAGVNFPSWFRGEIQNKQIVYNSHPDVEKLLPVLAADYLEEAKRFFQRDQDDDQDESQDYDDDGDDNSPDSEVRYRGNRY